MRQRRRNAKQAAALRVHLSASCSLLRVIDLERLGYIPRVAIRTRLGEQHSNSKGQQTLGSTDPNIY